MKYKHTDSSFGGTGRNLPQHAASAARFLATVLALVLLPALCSLSFPLQAAAADQSPLRTGKAQTDSRGGSGSTKKQGADVPRAHPWAFETGRSASIWSGQGVGGDELFRNAMPQSKKSASRSTKSSETASRRSHSGLEVSVDREDRYWDPAPGTVNPGESKALDSQHRVRAFATVQDENVSVGVGPEVIVRDEYQPHTLFNRNSSQPEVDAGVGMRFQIDF